MGLTAVGGSRVVDVQCRMQGSIEAAEARKRSRAAKQSAKDVGSEQDCLCSRRQEGLYHSLVVQQPSVNSAGRHDVGATSRRGQG